MNWIRHRGSVGVGLGFGIVGTLLAVALVAQSAPDYRKPPAKEWPLVGGDWGNTRYSPLAQITPANVKTLKGAWMTRLGSGFGPGFSQQATPVVKDGVMYLTTGEQDVFALDGKTGNIIWEYRPKSARRISPHRGVALGEGMVFHTVSDQKAGPGGTTSAYTYLVALDQKTGKVRWQEEFGADVPAWAGRYTSAPPFIHDGRIFIGLSGGDSAQRGRFTAHDAKTGKEIWRYYTIPGPGEFGNDTWEKDSWMTGGGSVWVQPAFDPDLGLVYINTGNPWPGYNGAERGGDNLFTCSVVALDYKTGEYRWHFQTSHHDIWDFDTPTPLILFDQVYDGQMRKAIAAHTKQGWVYTLDRVTGKPLIPVEEKPMPQDLKQKTAKTQPVPAGDPTIPQCAPPVKGFKAGCIWTPHSLSADTATPGAGGDWAPGAYDPRSGYLYFTTGVATRVFFAQPQPTREEDGNPRPTTGGGRFGPVGTREYGLITALDSRTNKKVWEAEVPYQAGFGSGVLATGGGLLFHGGTDGFLRAFDSKTGKELWRFQTGFGADAPVAVYEIDGEEYVAIATGGVTDSPDEARGDAVWAFKLGGRLNPLNGPPPPVSLITWDTAPRPFDRMTGRNILIESTTIYIGRSWNVQANGPGEPSEYTFGPVRTVVPVGSEITFINEGEMPHTATDQGGTWDTGLLKTDEKITLKFDKPGEFTNYCIPHPWMLGQLIVK